MSVLAQPAARPAVPSPARVRVPLADLKAQFAQIRDEALPALAAIAESGGYVLGQPVAAFEQAFAQAHLATYQGKPVGGFGLAAGFSFYPGKNLGACGEGGAVVTDDDALATRMRALRDHAQTQRYHHAEIGFNYRMDAMQGAVLGIKMQHIARW